MISPDTTLGNMALESLNHDDTHPTNPVKDESVVVYDEYLPTHSSTTQTTDLEAELKVGPRSWLVTVGVCFAIFAQLYSITIAGSNVPFIARDLGDPTIAPWIVQAPLLVQSAISPFLGRLSDAFGRKWFAVVPPLVAFVGSVIAAKATTMNMLIGGGVLIGPTLATISIVQSISAEIMPRRWRVVPNALAFVGGALGGIVGSLGGGKLASQGPHGWRNMYWLQAALHLLSALILLCTYFPTPRPRASLPRSMKEYVWSFDPVGSFLFVIGTTLILLGINWAGGSYGWVSAHVLGPLLFGAIMLIAFGFYEWKGRSDGLVAHEFFSRGPNFALSILGITIEGWVFYGAVTNIIPTAMVNLGFADTAFQVAIRQVANTFTAMGMSVIIMIYATKYRDLKNPLVASFAIFLVANICLATLEKDQKDAQLAYIVIVGLGQAGPLTLMIASVQLSTPHRYLSAATGLGFSARAIGGAFGSCILNVIINNRFNENWAPKVAAAATSSGLSTTSVPQFLKALAANDMPALQALIGDNSGILAAAVSAQRGVYAGAYRIAFCATIPLTVAALLTCLFLKDMKAHMSNKIEATLEKVPVTTDRTSKQSDGGA